MTQSGDFSDQDLSAYLDDEAPEVVAKAIRDVLPHDSGLRARLDELRAGQDAFTSAMDVALSSAPPMPDLPKPARSTRSHAWPMALVGALAGAALTLGLTWNQAEPAKPGWRDVVANYQSLYVTETLAQVETDPAVQQADLARVSAELGFDLTELPEVEGLTYKRVQQLGFNGKPLAQLTFLTADGGPVALCIIPSDGKAGGDMRAEVLSGLDTYSWIDNGFGVLLVGPKGQDGLKDAAETFRTVLKNRPV